MTTARRVSHPHGALRDAAVRQNATWCDLVCRSHGLSTTWGDEAWTCATRSPELHPDAVTLRPQADVARLLASIDSSSGCSVKDSFAELDLSPWGFDVLFDATWLTATGTGSDTTWRPLTTPAELVGWHAAWLSAGGVDEVLDPTRLASHDVVLVGEIVGGVVRAGAVLYALDGVVGAGNLFGPDAWHQVIALVDPATSVVGYERGDQLASAIAAGASELGPLRVWLRRGWGG
jgi:hypothetical protein